MLRRVVVGSAIAAGSWYAFYRATRWRATWGHCAGEAAMVLPGDELVPAPTADDTRAITIDVPPGAVWPWLVQMGYGRAGWYSYDRLDMRGRSADRIVPELQSLAVGDVMPTDPAGGFEVRVLEPGRAIALYVDDALVAARERPAGRATETSGVAASGAFLDTALTPAFRVSWAFVLEPVEGGRSRLLERVRVWFGPGGGPAQTVLAPVLGFGVFVMMHRQMVGIRARAERRGSTAPLTAMPADPEAGDVDLDAVDTDELRVIANGHAAPIEPAAAG